MLCGDVERVLSEPLRVLVMQTDILFQSHRCNAICQHLKLTPTSNAVKVCLFAYVTAFHMR